MKPTERMRPKAIALLAVMTVVTAACGSSARPSTPGSSALNVAPASSNQALPSVAPSTDAAGQPSVTPSAPLPSASPNPEVTRAIAAHAYHVAMNAYNKTNAAIDKKYRTLSSLAQARAAYKAYAKADAVAIAAIKKIVFPPDMAADVHTLLIRYTAVQALDLEGTRVKTWADVASVRKAFDSVGRQSSAASNQVRSDLGLPPVGQ